MMEDHARNQEEIPAYVAGRLDPAARPAVEAHLAECPDCASLVESWREIAGAMRDGAGLLGDHPSPSVLEGYATGSSEVAESVESHIETCAPCRVEVVAWRRRGSAAIAAPRRRLATARAVAAGFVLGLGLSLTVVWLAEEPAGPWDGSAELLTLAGQMRGESIPSVSLSPGQPYLPVALVPALPAEASGRARVRFMLIREGAGEIVSLEMTAARIREQIAGPGVVTLLLPAKEIRPGRHRLAVVAPDAEAQEITFDVR